MDKGKMHYLIGIVYQYGGSLIVPDLEIVVQGNHHTFFVQVPPSVHR